MKCISPLIIFCSPLVLLRPAFSQCQGTWSIDINKSDYKDFSRCNLPRSTSSGDGAKLIWKVTGSDDNYDIYLRQNPYPGYSDKKWEGNWGNKEGSYDLKDGKAYFVTFICKNSGIFASNCDNGRFEWHFVKCACPAGSTAKDNSKCVKNDFVTAKDVQCSTPTTPPSPSPSKPYIFKYEVKDFEFEPPLNDIDTKKVSSTSNGIISNCADRVTTDHEVKMSIAIGNSQSMTVSKSFTSSTTNEYAAGVSVRAKAETGVIFAKASVEAEARFDYSHSLSLEESETEEDSTTMETSSEIEFDLAMSVSVAPNTCVKYDYWTQVSSEPLAVPYKAKTYLTILRNDENQEQVTDLDTLQSIQKDVFSEYDSTIDTSFRIVYPIDGIFSSLYAAEAVTTTSNCDVCGSGSNTALPSPTANPSSPQPTPAANPPLGTQFNAAEDPSSVAAVLGLGGIAVGVMFVFVLAITLN
mmetsp:Transcript_7976/g.12056  ORF Transcript_7976/g.12056 Transcript_7976/m.12056 type:complete len:467 (-) Transcript_7976:1928-3328(-)